MTSNSLSDEELIAKYLKAKVTLSEATLKNYRALLTQFFKFCQAREISLVTAQESDVAEFISQYDYKSTKDSYKTILNIFYKWCFKRHLVKDNPVDDITIKTGRKNTPDLMRERDFKQIASRCEGLREISIVNFFWYTGVRAKELRYMRLQDVALSRGLIYISNSKTMKGYRSIPIHPNFNKLLEKYVKRRKQIPSDLPWLFLTKRGTQFGERTIIHLIKSLQNYMDTSFSCHDFRRAFVTRLYRQTTDLVLCQRLVGHASIKTTQGYIIDDIEEHMKKFNSLNF